jgi:uncharacterized ferredoxin-like protein
MSAQYNHHNHAISFIMASLAGQFQPKPTQYIAADIVMESFDDADADWIASRMETIASVEPQQNTRGDWVPVVTSDPIIIDATVLGQMASELLMQAGPVRGLAKCEAPTGEISLLYIATLRQVQKQDDGRILAFYDVHDQDE